MRSARLCELGREPLPGLFAAPRARSRWRKAKSAGSMERLSNSVGRTSSLSATDLLVMDSTALVQAGGIRR